MKNKSCLKKIALTTSWVLSFSAIAKDNPPGAISSYPTFYAGIAGSLDHLNGKRTEQLTGGGTNTLISFSDNRSLSANGFNAQGLAGFLWTIPASRFVLSPEIYLGQGSVEATLQESGVDPAIPSGKGLQSSLKRNFTMGFVTRFGFYLSGCQNNLAYLLVGLDQSRFQNTFALSSGPDAGGNQVPTLFEKRSKWLSGRIIGLGFERKFNHFKLGVDVRYTFYSSWGGYSRQAAISDDVISIQFKPRIISTSLTFCYLF